MERARFVKWMLGVAGVCAMLMALYVLGGWWRIGVHFAVNQICVGREDLFCVGIFDAVLPACGVAWLAAARDACGVESARHGGVCVGGGCGSGV
jgi:hypothetical protein